VQRAECPRPLRDLVVVHEQRGRVHVPWISTRGSSRGAGVAAGCVGWQRRQLPPKIQEQHMSA
jgi:hypothetical protein